MPTLRALILIYVAAFFTACPCREVYALDPGKSIAQFGHTAWRLSEGALGGRIPTAIAQTTDGYLWIGTQSGLLRFDGVRFEQWTPSSGHSEPPRGVHALAGTNDGSLWIGMGEPGWPGIGRLKDGELAVFGTGKLVLVDDIVEDLHGKIWFARSRQPGGPLCEVVAEDVLCHGASAGVSVSYGVTVFRDLRGRVWLGGTDGLSRWESDHAMTFSPDALQEFREADGVTALAQRNDDELLVGIVRTGKGLGLQILKNGNWSPFRVPGLDGEALAIMDLLQDRDGSLWIATVADGLYRVRGNRVDHFTQTDGLSGNATRELFEDREGVVWLITNQGIDSFREAPVVSASEPKSLDLGNSFYSMIARRDGSIWIARDLGLSVVRDGVLSRIGADQGYRANYSLALMEDHVGALWLCTDAGLYIYEHGRLQPVSGPDGAPLRVYRFAEDPHHVVWAAGKRQRNIFRIENRQPREIITRLPVEANIIAVIAARDEGAWVVMFDGTLGRLRGDTYEDQGFAPIPGAMVRETMTDEDGTIWGAGNRGLVVFRNGERRILDDRNGLPCAHIYSSVRDDSRAMWMFAECGVLSVSNTDLEQWWKDPRFKVRVRQFDGSDGARTGVLPGAPAAAKSGDGKLWFASDTTVQVVDPANLRENRLPPPVHVEQLIADGKVFPSRAGILLAPRTRDIEIRYTATSLVNPSKVRFRYRLENREREWHHAGTRRQAFYDSLPPGQYHFHVIASNNDGAWNNTGATLSFEIPPAYYQTLWFRVLCIAAAGALLWLLITLRVRVITEQIHSRLAERLLERERIARALHDTLLQGFHGLMLRFQVALGLIPEDQKARAVLEDTLNRADALLTESRDHIRDLRHECGPVTALPEALANAGKELRGDLPIAMSVTVEGSARDVNSVIHDEIYRVGREALANAFRHSQGNRVEVEIDYDHSALRLRVRDNGRGISPEVLRAGGREGHWGLSSMRERAHKIGGQLRIWNRSGVGTEVELQVPAGIAYTRSTRPSWWRRLLHVTSGESSRVGPRR